MSSAPARQVAALALAAYGRCVLDRGETIGFAIAGLLGALCLLIVATWPTPSRQPGEPGPNTVVHIVRHDYQRLSPRAQAALGDDFPTDTVVETTARYGSNACLEELQVVTKTTDGELLERTDQQGSTVTRERPDAPTETSEVNDNLGTSCVVDSSERKAAVEQVARQAGGVLDPVPGGGYRVMYPLDPDTFANGPSADDIDVASVEVEVALDSAFHPGTRTITAVTSAGDSIVLQQSTLLLYEVHPAD